MPRGEEESRCYYCGMPAECRDHVVPVAVWRMYEAIGEEVPKNRILLVPACNECNRIAGSTVQNTIGERKKFIKDRLREKHRKLIASPEWADDEIEALGPHLRGAIKALQIQQNLLKLRLSW